MKLLDLQQVRTAYRDGVPLLYRSRSASASREWKRVRIDQFHPTGRRVLLTVLGSSKNQRMTVCWVMSGFMEYCEPVHPADAPSVPYAKPVDVLSLSDEIGKLTDKQVLEFYDLATSMCLERGIDPIRRVRTVTTVVEVPL